MATIVFFGSGPVAAASLSFLATHFDIEAVITKAVPTHHKGIAPVEVLARKLQLQTILASNKQELDTVIDAHHFQSRLGIIIDYGVIVSQAVIDTFEQGIINSHFSLLPQWRGADPITYSILSGQSKTGVSLMLIEPSLDTGKLIAQKSLTINPGETTPTLTERLIDLSNEMIATYLPLYQSGNLSAKSQPHPDRATYSHKLLKSDGLINWQKPAEQIEREIRAYRGWPSSYTTLNNKRIIILKAHVSDTKNTALDVQCQDGKYLSIDELIGPTGKTMNAQAFLNGYAAG